MMHNPKLTEIDRASGHHFRIIDEVATNRGLSYLDALETVLPHFRYDKWARPEVDTFLILDSIFTDEMTGDAELSDDVESFFYSDEAEEEVRLLSAALGTLGFYRDDSPANIVCLTTLFSKEYDDERRSEAPYNDMYNAFESWYYDDVKLTEVELNKIFEVLGTHLSSNQYFTIRFYIKNLYRSLMDKSILEEENYDYTENEWQLIEAAIRNIRNSAEIKEAMSEIMGDIF